METVVELVETAARRHAHAIATIAARQDGERAWTYAELWDEAGRMAGLLREHGVGAGDRVVLWGRNQPRWVVAFLGVIRLGAVAVPLDAQSNDAFLSLVCRAVEPRLTLADARLLPDTGAGTCPRLCLDELDELLARQATPVDLPRGQPDDLCEIVFTSGSTGQPKGVMLTHRNLASNVTAVSSLMPALPSDRLLSILPLSHVFEQTMGLLLPLTGGACVVYPPGRVSADIVRLLGRYRITALLVVPQVLRLMLDGIEREVERRGHARQWRLLLALAGRLPMPARRLLFRRLRARLGGHLRVLICGGARLDPALADAWERLGLPVVQGYGLTETAPCIAGTGIADRRLGAVGRVLPGQQARLGEDGEIQTRGPNVTPGYWRDPAATAVAFVDGWFRTGDIGAFDSDGYLYLRGRVKDMIVLANGLNVHAADIEQALVAEPEIRAAAVVEMPDVAGKPAVHAALIGPESDAAARAAVWRANARLLPHQQVRAWSRWPDECFPQTTTLKVRKHEVRARLLERRAAMPAQPSTVAAGATVTRLIADAGQLEPGQITLDQRLGDDLGFDSLARVELALAVENQFGVALADDHLTGATTVGDLAALIAAEPVESSRLPAWPRAAWSRWSRAVLQIALLAPLIRLFFRLDTASQPRLPDERGPVILAANHSSHLDSLVVLAALPARQRARVAVAAGADYFFTRRWLGALVGLLLNAFPFARQGGAMSGLRVCRQLADEGWWLLLFPEGTRSLDGRIGCFRQGVGHLATEIGATVVPARIDGAHRLWPKGGRWPRPGRVRVRFGQPLRFDSGTSARAATAAIEAAVRALEGER